MRSLEHSARTAIGTEFRARPHEIISHDEAPADYAATHGSAAALEQAMLTERAILPSVQSLLAQARKDGTLKNQKPVESKP